MSAALWPQYTVAGLILLGIGHALAKYGKQKTGSYGVFEIVIGPALTVWLLYMGGFWSASP